MNVEAPPKLTLGNQPAGSTCRAFHEGMQVQVAAASIGASVALADIFDGTDPPPSAA